MSPSRIIRFRHGKTDTSVSGADATTPPPFVSLPTLSVLPINPPDTPAAPGTESAATVSAVSHGEAMTLALEGLQITAPAGAIAPGEKLTITHADSYNLLNAAGPSIGGGPYIISTTQGEPSLPVRVALSYDRSVLGAGSRPLIVHGWDLLGTWLPESTTDSPAQGVATAYLDTFSPIDVMDNGTYYAGLLLHNRSDMPDDCGDPPPWATDVSLPVSHEQPLNACFSAEGTNEAVLHLVNNRGYPMMVSVTGLPIQLDRAGWSDSLEGDVAEAFARHASDEDETTFVLAPNGEVHLTIDRPPEQPGPTFVRIVTRQSGNAAAYAAVAWSVLSTAAGDITLPIDAIDCVISTLPAKDGGGPTDVFNAIHVCADTAVGISGKAKKAFEKIAYGLAIDDFFYKLQDRMADAAYATLIGFDIRGTGETDANIILGPLALGSVAAGVSSTFDLTATGGVGPYSFHFFYPSSTSPDLPPTWATLSTNGRLILTPPASDAGPHTLYVFATDALGRHSPYQASAVTFSTDDSVIGHGTPAWSHDGRYIAIVSDDGRLFSVWDSQTGDRFETVLPSSTPDGSGLRGRQVAWAASTDRLVVSAEEFGGPTVYVGSWDASGGFKLGSPAQRTMVTNGEISPDGRYLSVIASGATPPPPTWLTSARYFLDLDSDALRLAEIDDQHCIHSDYWIGTTGHLALANLNRTCGGGPDSWATLDAETGSWLPLAAPCPAFCDSVSPDGRFVGFGNNTTQLAVIRTSTGQTVSTVSAGPAAVIRNVRWASDAPDPYALVTTTPTASSEEKGGALLRVDLESGDTSTIATNVYNETMSPHAKTALWSDGTGHMRFWTVASGVQDLSPSSDKDVSITYSSTWSPTDDAVAFSPRSDGWAVWRSQTDTVTKVSSRYYDLDRLAWSRDGKRLALHQQHDGYKVLTETNIRTGAQRIVSQIAGATFAWSPSQDDRLLYTIEPYTGGNDVHLFDAGE